MYGKSWTLFCTTTLLVAFTPSPSSASTLCNAFLYGNPNPPDCVRLLLEDNVAGTRGLEGLDREDHLFYAEDFDKKPSDVTATQWKNKVPLAKMASLGGCSILLAVVTDASGTPKYDTGTYLSIAEQAITVQNQCSHYAELGSSELTMQGAQGWTGNKGQILTILFSNTSAFATNVADRRFDGLLPDLRAISAKNPPTSPAPEPVCGRSHYCSKARDCRGAIGCICVADKWHGEFFSSSCKWPLPKFRGLLEIDSVNATRSAFTMNSTLAEEGSMDFACPCNCTYVSKACCNSPTGIVYEAPDLRLGSVLAPSANLTCDSMTGEFQASNNNTDVMLIPRGLDVRESKAAEPGSVTANLLFTPDIPR